MSTAMERIADLRACHAAEERFLNRRKAIAPGDLIENLGWTDDLCDADEEILLNEKNIGYAHADAVAAACGIVRA